MSTPVVRSFADPVVAQKTRDVFTRLMISVLDQERPPYQYGTVTQIDPNLGSCLVLLPPDTTPIRVKYGAMRPAAVGQVVRISGNRNDRFISDVIGGAVQADRPVVDMAAPQGVVIEPYYDSVTVRWTAMEGIPKYEVQFASDAAFTTMVVSYDTVSNQLTRTNLNVGQTIYARVRALSSSAAGPWSATVSTTIEGLPSTGSDGMAPSESPQPVLTPGIGFLLAEWLPVSNLDSVTYEVHISTTSGFTATAATKIGEVVGTHYFIRRMPNGTTLSYDLTYHVRIIAKDSDGAAFQSAQASASPVRIETTDVGRISTSKIGDGSAPSSSPTPTIQNGIGFLYATWTHPANADPITYDIHVSTTNDFTPSTNTLVGSTESNFAFIRKQGPGATPANGVLVYGVTYYVKLIARDVDGQAAAGAQGSGTPLKALATDIGDNQITTQHILAGSITAASGIIADAAIGTAKIQDAAITTAKIGNAQITTALIGDLQVVSAKIADAAIATAKIANLAVTNAKIADLTADKITSSSLTSANITLAGGSFRAGSPPTTGLEINSQGISLYSSSVRTVFLDAVTGNGTFSGTITGSTITGSTIKTAATGERIEIASGPENIDNWVANYIKFYSPRSDGSDPHRPGRIFGDVNTTSGHWGQLYLRPPYTHVGSGETVFGLESHDTGATLVVLGGGASQPFMEFRGDASPRQVNFYSADEFTVYGRIFPFVAINAPVIEGDTIGSRASLRMISTNTAQFSWSGGYLHFYVDNTFVASVQAGTHYKHA